MKIDLPTARQFFRKKFIQIFTWGLFPAFVALIGAVAGLWSSLYSAELKNGLSQLHSSGFSKSFSVEVIVGAALVFAFFILYALQQTAKNMQEEDARGAMMAETERLKVLVERLETLPPDGFLQEFQDLYKEVAYLPLMPWTEETITSEDIEAAIRSVLAAIASLAHKFDGAPNGKRYAANLMLCRTKVQLECLTATERENIEARLIFCPDLPAPKLNGLAAVLDLVPQLSSDFNDNDSQALGTPIIALPVPNQHRVDLGPEHGQRYTVLPGAPFVAAMHQYAAFESIRALLTWCNEKADLTRATCLEINQFFHNGLGAGVRSFISVPVCMTVDKNAPIPEALGGLSIDVGVDAREDCLGVLNIHSESENILGTSGYGMFVPIIEPFIRVLALLLVSYGTTISLGVTRSAILGTDKEDKHDQEPILSEALSASDYSQANDKARS